jgi:D-amino-acid dehydrogenase
MTKAKSALVIGAGIIGITSAYALAKQGWNVTILDARDGPALGASFGNGRQLSYSHTDALANPKLLGKLPSLAMGSDDAFRLSLSPDPALLTWLVQFLRNCTATRFRDNTLAALALAEVSRRGMETLLERHPIEFEQQDAGKLVLYRNEAELAHASTAMQVKVEHGSMQRTVDRDEAIALEPALDQCADDLVGAIYSPNDQTGNCSLFAAQLLKHAQREYGVNFLRNARVTTLTTGEAEASVQLESGEVFHAAIAVVCAGH